MTRDDDAPELIPAEQSKGFGLPREIDGIQRRLIEGSRQMASLRDGQERLRDELARARLDFEAKLAALQLAEAAANDKIRRSAESRAIDVEAEVMRKSGALQAEIAKLENVVAPRATTWRVLGVMLAAVLTFGPILGWAWTRFEQLDTRLRAAEARSIELGARIDVIKGAP